MNPTRRDFDFDFDCRDHDDEWTESEIRRSESIRRETARQAREAAVRESTARTLARVNRLRDLTGLAGTEGISPGEGTVELSDAALDAVISRLEALHAGQPLMEGSL